MNKVLFDYCRYYKGEKTCPFDDERALLWNYESGWCKIQNDKDSSMDNMLYEYNVSGLCSFEPYDGTPVSLKALLFNRFCHWSSGSMYECIEPFKEWYIVTYRKAGL